MDIDTFWLGNSTTYFGSVSDSEDFLVANASITPLKDWLPLAAILALKYRSAERTFGSIIKSAYPMRDCAEVWNPGLWHLL